VNALSLPAEREYKRSFIYYYSNFLKKIWGNLKDEISLENVGTKKRANFNQSDTQQSAHKINPKRAQRGLSSLTQHRKSVHRDKKVMPSKEEEEEEKIERREDRYASELLSRMEDLGIEVPPTTSPRALRAHKHQPRQFTKIAQQLACAIGPLVKMTGADNVNLALQSCVTLKNIRGASYEDCASRALGALAVLAVSVEIIIKINFWIARSFF